MGEPSTKVDVDRPPCCALPSPIKKPRIFDLNILKNVGSPEDRRRSSLTSATFQLDCSLLNPDDETTLPKSMIQSMPGIYNAKLAPLDLSFGKVSEDPNHVTLNTAASRQVVRNALVNAHKARASVCFAFRRPGCVICFEQAEALKGLLAEFPDSQVAAWGAVKEIHTDDEGLLTLYQKHFRFPFFRDTNQALYKALGDRKLGIIPNPIKILNRYLELKRRLKTKGIEGTFGRGEGVLLGGVIIFDRKGNIRYAHPEHFGQQLPVDEIREALRKVVDEGNQKHSSIA
eukprot:CAMPEP_0176003290 /NCGR_PEP_ID=MMETSP0120_2-20121206/1097_1 /TAXON_ID=160619 /ORGANISM="Kryptoperidinium foliaceum, Strain CCMP 1326" /LENGTH=286 /DNA_ID=CAMNT_0017335927 /DNA_START=348 /DNA_END=1206 /DNA_ORIENTATION=+